jgi:hypothetical protein
MRCHFAERRAAAADAATLIFADSPVTLSIRYFILRFRFRY